VAERIHKLLATAGIGSRRQIEAWIEAGRVTVNGRPASKGQAVEARDRIAVDGRPVRLRDAEEVSHRALLYHRPPGEPIKAEAERTAQSSLERLPRVRGRRWLAVSPLSAADGGLELFLTDGELAAALSKHAPELTMEYSLRLRGGFDETTVPAVLAAAAADVEASGALLELAPTGGEAANRWARAVVRGLRPRDLKRIFELCGIELNRVIRTRFGPLAMDRALARGVSRRLSDGELASLRDAAGLPKARPPRPGQARAGAPQAQRPTADGAAAGPARPRRARPGSRTPRR
jgi:23S rRNA pseudouridine2605 synthase